MGPAASKILKLSAPEQAVHQPGSQPAQEFSPLQENGPQRRASDPTERWSPSPSPKRSAPSLVVSSLLSCSSCPALERRQDARESRTEVPRGTINANQVSGNMLLLRRAYPGNVHFLMNAVEDVLKRREVITWWHPATGSHVRLDCSS